ncbi:hypothetical protein IFR04_000946 [Cadophora malorum]|uniref:Uncharacterized protein n=1 Tax=Cadophora malorum TaxID=108018 RepID=A0A8H7WJR5_9HELO|nr:hypothetical protein IFR04_000946 [Cadophora malorum]
MRPMVYGIVQVVDIAAQHSAAIQNAASAVLTYSSLENMRTLQQSGGAVGSGVSTSTSTFVQSSTGIATTRTSAVETPLPVTSTTSAGQTSQKIPLPTPVSTEPSGNGTAVGAVIVVASLALLGFFLYRQRNNTNKLKAQMELLQHTPDTGDSEPEVSAYGTRDQYYKDAQIQTAYEVEARHGMTEIAGRREVAEASAISLGLGTLG